MSHSRALASVWLRHNEQDDHVAAHSFVEDEEALALALAKFIRRR